MKRMKAIVLSLSLITVMAGAAVSPALGAIAAYFTDVDRTVIQFVITLPALLIIITSLLFNQIASRIPGKVIAILGLILYVVGGVGAAFGNTIYAVLVCRVLLGIGVGLIMPLSTGLIPYFFAKEEQSKLMGYASAMNNLGGMIALGLSGFLVSISWRFSFAVYLLGLIELVAVIAMLPSFDLQGKSNKIDTETIRKIVPYTILMFIVMIVFYAFTTNFSIIMTETSIIPTSLIGIVMAVQNVAAFLIGVKLSSVTKHLHENIKYLGGLLFMAGFFFLGFGSNVIIIMLGLVMVGIGYGILVPILNSQIAILVDKDRAPAAMAIMSVMMYLGQFLSPMVLGLLGNIIHMNGIRAPYYIAGVLALIVTICFVGIKTRTE